MVTHDVDEAVLLSDRIVMLSNGPAAAIGEILTVPLARQRAGRFRHASMLPTGVVSRQPRGQRAACLGFLERLVALRKWASLIFLAVALGAAGAARAGVCDAKFMHDGGALQLSGSGNIALGVDLAFTEVVKSNGGNCRARVRGVGRFSYAGLPPGKSRLDYLMTVKGGQARFLKYVSAGEAAQPSTGQFDLRRLGLFDYDSKLSAGQKLPGSSFRLRIGKEAPIGGQPAATVRIGEKTVGRAALIHTALGQQSCHPITYTRSSDPTMLAFQGLVIPIPGMNTTVTDWYCPALNLVMKQDIDQGGVKSAVEVTQIK